MGSDSVLYLTRVAQGDTIRIGVDVSWGGSIVELSWNGMDFVNRFDAGREIQLALYDGNQSYDFTGKTAVYGWDPVQAGDRYGHGSPVLVAHADTDSIYTETQPNEWYPDNKGGGPHTPISTDTRIKQWISFVAGQPRVVRVHYRITHNGGDTHANSFQEFPAVYVDLRFNRFVYYDGAAPWKNDSLRSVIANKNPRGPLLYMAEDWAAFVNDSDIGLSVYVPHQYHYGLTRNFSGTSGPTGSGTNYYRPATYFSLGPNAVIEGDVYLVVGDYHAARASIYALRKQSLGRDPFAPLGYLDHPSSGDRVRRTAAVSGWAFDNVGVTGVQVVVDGKVTGTATYGRARPDVRREFPNAPLQIGFNYTLDTSNLMNGEHTLQIQVTDSTGNVALFPTCLFSVAN